MLLMEQFRFFVYKNHREKWSRAGCLNRDAGIDKQGRMPLRS